MIDDGSAKIAGPLFDDLLELEEERCHPQEPVWIQAGIFLSCNDSPTVAKATFNNDALHQFFGFTGSPSGTGYLGYEMEWEVKKSCLWTLST